MPSPGHLGHPGPTPGQAPRAGKGCPGLNQVPESSVLTVCHHEDKQIWKVDMGSNYAQRPFSLLPGNFSNNGRLSIATSGPELLGEERNYKRSRGISAIKSRWTFTALLRNFAFLTCYNLEDGQNYSTYAFSLSFPPNPASVLTFELSTL